jgi:sugar phosphate isomerase/epimerase
MTNPQHDIRIGTLVSCSNSDPVSYIRQILQYGFESFQLNWWQTLGGADLPKLADQVAGMLEGSDVCVSALGIYGNPLENGEMELETRKGLENLVKHAHLFGTDIVTGFTGRLRDKPLRDSLPAFERIFSPLADLAAEKDVRIAFENCAMGGSWASGDWNIAHDPEAWQLLFETIPSERLGLEWEPCHQMVALIDPLPQIRDWAPRIFHVHGKDATIRKDVIRRFGIHGEVPFVFHRTPGFGDSNWTDIITELRLAGFTGAIDIEGWHDPVYKENLEMTGQVRALEYLKTCRGGAFAPNPQ